MANYPPDRMGFTLALGGWAGGLRLALGQALVAERGRWPLWLPVFLGLGIGLYFAQPAEPPAWAGPLAALAAATGVAATRRWPPLFLGAMAALTVAAGFAVIQIRAAQVAAPVVERHTGALMLEGRVAEVETLPEGGARLTLEHLAIDRDDVAVPLKARIRLKPSLAGNDVTAGDRIRLRAMLMPPPQPAMPGSFDFARFSWFRQLGAVGTALGPPEILARAEPGGWTTAVNALRHSIAARILAVLPGDAGAVAVALSVGDQMPISAPMIQAYRDSGLVHILSISGLHITMAAGLVFVGLRAVLALAPPLALRYPIKKWAAALAIAFAWFYTLLAGAPVPAQRAFLMTALALAAVLLDRVALSMRLVAWAAVAVLLWAPEEMIGPSFQMSFAAVAALIAAYEGLTPRVAAWRAAHPGPVPAIGLYLSGVALTTLIAGSATAVYGVFHFNRFALWSVAANMLAVPLTGFWVMPWALVMFLLLPLGLENLALVPMGWGVDAMNRIALGVAALPHSAVTVPVLPLWGMLVFTLGGLWLCLWRRRWRWWGVLPMAAGLASMALAHPPDLLVDGRGDGMALRTAEGQLLLNGRGGRILKETWSRRAGPEAPERWPKKSSSRDGGLRCDERGCLWRTKGRVVALVRGETAPETACAGADVVISSVPLRGACRGARVVVDRFDLWRRGAHALWLAPDGGVRIETVAGWQGDRPWAWRPRPRGKTGPKPSGSPPRRTEEADDD
ncbi:ComEC/Rec2 family competence protein [Magnetospirillum sp. SS-4]|uniref:ComEC/Rec2 family competence protein n=1 Tax=Magnetospirillum sp. SS-4 TaxID=2681465 RepID=UPI0013851A2E|nr:ComEC/Rec2 family competence protein [Magnetospirillum sp. SS-4]CAA7627568.1 Membrane metal-binding protein [Magnetospirillum sp. SS-4]